MNQLTDLPDLGRSFMLMKLNDKLREVSERTLFGLSIQRALHKGPMNKALLDTIWEHYVDNPTNAVFVLGEDTVLLIAQILHK